MAWLAGGKLYTLKGDTKQIDKYAGQTVTVTGDVSRTTVTVRSIAPGKILKHANFRRQV